MRWTPKRKKDLVDRFNAGHIREVKKLLAQHNISREEFGRWIARLDLFGIEGLKTTKLQRVLD